MSQSDTSQISSNVSSEFPIVGIGASAGGLEALRGLFTAMPGNTGAGFVLVQHLDPTHDSLMAELLTKYAQIPVIQVVDGMHVEPNRLHVIPPNAEMTIAGGVLHLTEPKERRGMRMPIDRFFSSLAEDQEERAIAIVLSGTGTDGTYGVRLIKARGGMALAQDPTTSGYDGMPRSAVATGDVDYVLPVSEMPEVLRRYIEHFQKFGSMAAVNKQDQDYMDSILALLIERQEYDFRCYKRGTINRRVLRRMGLNHISSLQEYHSKLRDDEAEVRSLAKDLLIGVTSFFREPEAWNLLRNEVLTELFTHQSKHEVIRAWVPGCATGEEAYSLAIVLTEAGEAAGRANNIIVFATDVDREALEVARIGVYPESLVADIEPDRLKRFFTREGDNYLVKKRLREKVIFAPQNIITDPPFSNLSLISCRNLLIYIQSEYQERLMGLFHFSLHDGGYLFLGSSETVGQGSRLFEPLSKKWRIYRRIDMRISPAMEFSSGKQSLPALSALGNAPHRKYSSSFGVVAQKALVEQFAPASVLVDREYRVLYFHGMVRDYIGPAPGDPTDDLLMLAGEGIRGKIRSALRQAAAENERVEVGGGHVRRGDQWYTIRIIVTPLSESGKPSGLLLVSFEDERRFDPLIPADASRSVDEGSVFLQLEDELKNTREELRGTIEQMETSNDELKASNEEVMSMNEELQSTNEELETSKEELQSLNEELITLNSQLEDKVHELEETTNDLSNLLSSTEIATVFLDRHFRIRRYTPAMGNLMRLISSDIGRAVTDITWRFEDPRLLDDAALVLAGQQVDQNEVECDDKSWHLRRILPYRTERGHVEGVVVTFNDISSRKATEIALQQSESHLRRITDNIPALISYIDSDLCYRFNNAAYEHWFGIPPHEVLGKSVLDVVGAEVFEQIGRQMEAVLQGKSVSFDDWIPNAQGGSRYISAQYIPDIDEHGDVQGFFAMTTDLTEKRRTEEKIEQLNAENQRNLDEMRALLDAAPVGIFLGRDKSCDDMVMNRAGAEMLRIPPQVNPFMSGPDAHKLDFRVYHDGHELETRELPMQLAATEARAIEGFEERIEFPDGSHIDLLTYAAPIFNANGEVQGCVGTFADVTKSRKMERLFKETAERLRIHIENTPLGIIEWDLETTITNWSGSAENLFGWSADEALGKTIQGLGLVFEEDEERVVHVVSELLDGRAQTNRCLNRSYRKDGTVIWCEWFNSVIRDENGAFVSALSVALDMTERQRLEDALHERTRRLEEADRRKNVFLAMLGHELRNPLMPIRNVVQLLTMQDQKEIDMQWAAQVIDRQTEHLQRMIDDLLDMARIRKGELNIEKSSQQLQEIIEEALTMLQPMIDEKHHHLMVEMTTEPLLVKGDATRLLQVISNLVSNAVRYTQENGEIKVLLARKAENQALISVADNGKGISDNLLPYVFDIFNQAASHPERSNAGLGLGLSLVKQIVLLHHGEVNVESEGIGKGSRFSVILPLVDGENEQYAETPPVSFREKRAQASLDILLVDDNPDVRDSLQQLLSAFGHRVSVLDSGRKVVDAVRNKLPDLVLLDLGMPDMDGYQAARELATLPARGKFKVVAVTGYAADPQDADDPHVDFDGYLLKPITPDMLEPYLTRR
jgi:two-component system, chemotaxis family, CheB/CheR fusion protein